MLTIIERHNVIVEKHPHYQSLNMKLMEDVKKFKFFSPKNNTHTTNIQGSQYNFHSKDLWTPSMNLIVDWVYMLVREKVRATINAGAMENDGNPTTNLWFARYNKGDYTFDHDHAWFALVAFVYFVNSPPGSSPLVFSTSGKKIKAEEGKVVIFPGTLRHGVPPNKCDNRIVLAGNIGYDLNT
jgi:hypothetical protein